jgi:hypothetical protein
VNIFLMKSQRMKGITSSVKLLDTGGIMRNSGQSSYSSGEQKMSFLRHLRDDFVPTRPGVEYAVQLQYYIFLIY